jgi:hypothetical protein
MKKNYLIIILIFQITLTINAQPYISNTDFNPLVGESHTTYSFTPLPFDPGPSGANVTWDFSTISPGNTTVLTIVTPSSTPNGANYPSATIAADFGGYYEYMIANTSFFARSGIDVGFPMVYSDEEKILTYPFTYNSTFTDSFAASFLTTNRTGVVTGTADAYGTLILPWGTVSNVLRFHLVENFQDASPSGTQAYTSDNYFWVTPGVHYYLCSISSLTGTIAGKYIDATSVGLNSNIVFNSEMSSYPNPVTDKLNLKINSGKSIDHVIVADIAGKKLFDQQLYGFASEHQIDLSMLNSGFYILTVKLGNQSISQKILKK